MNIDHDLVQSWRKCRLDTPPYLFPNDLPFLANISKNSFATLNDYVSSPEFGSTSETSLHLGLLPIPYVGDLSKASIFILMLNPGLSPGDFFAEQFSKDYRQENINTLRQEHIDREYPFMFLNPKIAWHPGFTYWHNKLNWIIKAITEHSGLSYLKAMSKFSKQLACLELYPYHSKSFGANSIINSLPSTQAMLSFTNNILVPRAESKEILIIVARSIKKWDLPKDNNIISYKPAEARSAHLNFTSTGGKAIAKHLGLSIK